MNTTILTETLRALNPEMLTWKFGLYNTYKGRDGAELEWNLCNMRGISGQVDSLIEYLLKKPVAEKPVAAYSPFLSDKENIGALAQSDKIINEQLSDIIISIQKGQLHAPEDFTSGVLKKPTGFVFYGERQDEDGAVVDRVMFMRRGNPFMTGQAARLYVGEGEKVVSCNTPILKFAPAVDFMLAGGVCYILSSSIGKDLSLENRYLAIAQKCMGLVADSDIVSDYDRLEACAMKARNAKKFLDFDKAVLEHIVRLPIAEREEFLSTYGVTIDHNGRMDTSESEQCGLIVDLLCCRSCLDPLGRLSVGNNIMPRE